MHDGIDHDALYRLAESQAGYFTAKQALAVGMDRSTLRHHARPGGRYERVRSGLYRLRHFPSSPHEHVVAAWLPLSAAGAVPSLSTSGETLTIEESMTLDLDLALSSRAPG